MGIPTRGARSRQRIDGLFGMVATSVLDLDADSCGARRR